MKMKTNKWAGIALSALLIGVTSEIFANPQSPEKRIPITFTGGHETDRRDHGRPVVLVAAALGVPTDIFRKAFSGVTPARGRAPEPEQVRRNKDALLEVLAPYGVTNHRIDTVSDYYRYNPQRGEMWRNTPAEGYAVIVNNKIKSIKLTTPGSGYSSPPVATIAGYETIPIVTTLTYSKRFDANGSIATISVAPAKPGRN